ncbi:MAG TPA: class I SAM-dependent methyltransferase [Anaerolineales bacterium]|nr:class I SAM-dependent methyltransferase [Anaerolineales bacterium]
MQIKLNYDQIASDYNQRYPDSQTWDRGQALLKLASQLKAKTILEVGSGTGFWLNMLHQVTPRLYGLDFSAGMISQARKQPAPIKLTRGTAIQLPYQSGTFDLLYCVDAIHHFGDHRAFIAEAFRVLKKGGALAVLGHDPHEAGEDSWYIYNYFEDVYDTDLRRYPSGRSVMDWMKADGFQNISAQEVEKIVNIHVGDGVFNDPFIKQNATSQLALLSAEKYQSGLKRIRETLEQARAGNERIVFRSQISVKMFLGYKA